MVVRLIGHLCLYIQEVASEHLSLELFTPVLQYVVGPMAVAWLTARLNKKNKAEHLVPGIISTKA